MADTTILESVRIVSTPGILSGKPRIEGRRISVQNIVEHHTIQGWPIDEIAEAFSLTLGEIHAALAYYYAHQADIDQAIQLGQESVGQLEKERRDFAGSADVLNAVMTPTAAAHEFGIDPRTVRDAIESGKIEALKSGGTWLIRRKDAQTRWGKYR